eukprot:TRINITY_DN2738_c0_g3_i1.p1 TRINITY_DN2738_c0_g3~~TRINITY_DN2738_c0_g3_i1.p1  ORF type:complete len:267 (+),score=67.53 TRINITY_DN2738_c0_g3_i1:143-943(+)
MARMETAAVLAGLASDGAAEAHAAEARAVDVAEASSPAAAVKDAPAASSHLCREMAHAGKKTLAALRIFAFRTAAEGIAHSPRSATRLASCTSSRAWLGDGHPHQGSAASPCAGYADAVRAAQAAIEAAARAAAAAAAAAAEARRMQRRPALTSEQVIAQWPDEATTVMLRHFPNRYKVQELQAVVVAHGFAGQFDFFHLPMDFTTKRNRGYCYINFSTVDIAKRFVQTFHDTRRLSQYATTMVLEVLPASIQGREAMVAQFGGHS